MTQHEQKPEDKLSILRRIPLFASCTEEQLQLIAERSRLVEYKKGECVYREGERPDAFYLVATGRLQVYTVIDGHKHLFAVLHNGDTLGEISLLTDEAHSATVEALNDTLVLQLEKPDFDELINRIPSLVLYLSRLLSRRLRTKDQLGGAAEAMVIAVYSAAKGVGRTLFAVSLASALRRETNRDVLIVDFNTSDGEPNRFLGMPRPTRIHPATTRRLWSEESLEQEILDHPLGFHFLYAGELTLGPEGQHLVAPLVSGLAKRYRFILMDLPVELGSTVLKALTQADLIYLIADCTKDTVIRTNALAQQLKESVNVPEQQVKLIVNLMDQGAEGMPIGDVTSMLNRPVSFVLPCIDAPMGSLTPEQLLRLFESHDSAYANRVRRIARELGGVLVGLALGSGAALGLAHIGVLKVLEREKIPIDIVAGSSIGALIGGLWASGKSAEELEDMALRFKNPWRVRELFLFDLSLPVLSVIIGIPAGVLLGLMAGVGAGVVFGLMICMLLAIGMGPLVGGPIRGTQLMAKLEEDFGGKTFEQTWIPLKIVASNPMAREEVVFESGRIVDAVRASVSIPGIFKPPTHQGKICLDGGVVNPIPVSPLKLAGASRIIAVNVFPTTPELMAHQQDLQRQRMEWDAQLAARSLPHRLLARVRQELVRCFTPLVFDIIMRSMQSMEYQISEVACRDADVTLRPTMPGSHWLEFSHPEQFIQRGEEEALRQLPKIKRLLGMEEPAAAALTTLHVPGTITTS